MGRREIAAETMLVSSRNRSVTTGLGARDSYREAFSQNQSRYLHPPIRVARGSSCRFHRNSIGPRAGFRTFHLRARQPRAVHACSSVHLRPLRLRRGSGEDALARQQPNTLCSRPKCTSYCTSVKRVTWLAQNSIGSCSQGIRPSARYPLRRFAFCLLYTSPSPRDCS